MSACGAATSSSTLATLWLTCERLVQARCFKPPSSLPNEAADHVVSATQVVLGSPCLRLVVGKGYLPVRDYSEVAEG